MHLINKNIYFLSSMIDTYNITLYLSILCYLDENIGSCFLKWYLLILSCNSNGKSII